MTGPYFESWEHDNLVKFAKEAYVKLQQQEPVAWQWLNTAHFRKKLPKDAEPGAWRALYTAPPQRQPLTEEEIEQATGCDRNKPLWIAIADVARAIERAHGIGGEQ
jgi:hypothetical protein